MQTIAIDVQEIQQWVDLTRKLSPVFAQLGGTTPRTVPTNGNTRRNGNGGTTNTTAIPEIVKAFVASTPGGVAVSDIHAHLAQSGTTVSKDALARALSRMKKAKLLRSVGNARAMKYKLPPEAL